MILKIYKFIRPLLFRLDPERAHHFTLKLLNYLKPFIPQKSLYLPKKVMGIEFPNPIGLAAGFDKNADYFNALGKLGFGFIEVGTVTPKPQPGNPKPRLFRLTQDEALINCLGFNNKGVDHLIEQVKNRRFKGVLGINVGKNFLGRYKLF